MKKIVNTLNVSETGLSNDIAKSIAQWNVQRQYRKDQITIQNKTFFIALKDNIGVNPLESTTGEWGIFNPGGESDQFRNIDPQPTDIYPVGTKWFNVSFGSDTPLSYICIKPGVWQPTNQITLTRIRFSLYGTSSTYRSALSNIKFYDSKNEVIPNGWFVWGGSSGLGKPTAGSNYTGQSITAMYNSGGTADIEIGALFDYQTSISKITGSLSFANFRELVFIFSNGGSKTFTPSDGNLATCNPPLITRYGDSSIVALGETLTAAKLTNLASTDPGRLTGEAFTSAFNTLIAPLVERITALEARQEVRRSPDLPDFTLEWDIWERIVIDNVAWTITVTEYVRTSQTEAFPIAMRPMQGEAPIAMPPPTHANARTNANGEFVTNLPGGGSFTYGTSRNGSNSFLTFPANVYKEESHYYVDANDAVIPMTTMAQTIAADSTALGVGASAVSTEAVAFVIDLYRLDNTKITYRVPLS